MISEADKERMQKLLAIACDETANPVVRSAAMKAWEQMVIDHPPDPSNPPPPSSPPPDILVFKDWQI